MILLKIQPRYVDLTKSIQTSFFHLTTVSRDKISRKINLDTEGFIPPAFNSLTNPSNDHRVELGLPCSGF